MVTPVSAPEAHFHGAQARRLAVGIVVLEFASAVSTFVVSTLVPVIASSLNARGHLAGLLTGDSIGLFIATPAAAWLIARLGGRGSLSLAWR